ncbi:MAG: hypothetical protein WCS86_01765 [Candidatus Paceibacterota bacterium]
MSKLLKSKFLLGVMLVAVLVAGAVALVPKANAQQAIVTAADIQYAATVRAGSSGQAALIWQRFLNGYSTTAQLVEDGKFGPLSEVQAKAWQGSRGLAADGVLGAMSRASAVAQINAGAPASAFLPGCTSTVGFSSVTGLACNGAVTGNYPAGCTSAAGYSTTTGLSCSTVTTYPAGCTSAVGYSSTTGVKCDSTTGTVTGGAGNISALTKLSVYNDEEVNEGDSAKVLAFEVKADNGSDLNLTSLKLKFTHAANGGSGSYRLDRYMSDVAIYMGSTKVGSLSTSNFTRDTSNNTYSGSIPLSGVIVKAGQKITLVVEVTANSTIDSTDQHSAGLDWTVATVSVRYNDATGAILTDSTIVSELIAFSSVVSSGDLALKLATASGNPTTGVVTLSETGTTVVPMLTFSLKATGGAMDITKLRFAATSTGDSDGMVEMVNSWELFKGTDSIAVADSDPSTSTSWDYANKETAGTVIFSDISGLTLEKDTTTVFTVKATMKALATTSGAAIFDQADNLKLSFLGADLTDVTKVLVETTEGGDTVLTGDRTGSATGNIQTFYTKGMVATLVSATGTRQVSPDTATLTDSYTGVINFDITAIGEDVYIDKSALFDTTIASLPTGAGQGVVYYIAKNGSIVDQAVANYAVGPTSILTADGATTDDSTTDFMVKEGATRRFHLTATLSLDTTGTDGDGYYQIKLGSINWDPADATAAKFYTINLTDFISPVSAAAISDYAL